MERKWVSEVYDKILAKEKKVAQRSRNKIPYTTKDGVFDDRGKDGDLLVDERFLGRHDVAALPRDGRACLSGERTAHGDQTG